MSDHLKYLRNLNDSERSLFSAEYANSAKQPWVGVLLAFFLGGLGVHHFFLGRNVLGAVYLLFCWTFVPAMIAFVETFLMPSRVKAYNSDLAAEIMGRIVSSRRSSTRGVPVVTGGW